MKKVAVAMTHGHAVKWLQLSMYTFKKYKNETPIDFYVACSWPDHPSIKALTETDLGDNVTLIPCTIRLHSHATGLDQILDHIADMDYDYMLTTETDCVACRDGWVDWFVSFMKDESIGMAGFFWSEGTNHYNINPSFTLYNKKMLVKYHNEVRNNKEPIFYHPRGNKHDTDGGMDPSIKNVAGVFSETRGIKNPNPNQEEMILRGVPQAAWFEPGAWLYYRSVGEFGGVSVPVDHVYMPLAGHTTPEATYYGGKKNPYCKHLWGGTRAYDFLKHAINDNFVASCCPYWLEREDRIWRETVPEKYRKIVPKLMKEMKANELAKDHLPEKSYRKLCELLPNEYGEGK